MEYKIGTTVNFSKGKKCKIKLKGKVRKDSIALFLEVYEGQKIVDGNKKIKLKKIYLDGYIFPHPAITKMDKKIKQEVLLRAEEQRAQKERMVILDGSSFSEQKRNTNLYEYFVIYKNKLSLKKRNDKRVWAIKIFETYCKERVGITKLLPKMITPELTDDFIEYLKTDMKGDEIHYSRTTIYTIVHLIRSVFRNLSENGYFTKNPFAGCKIKKPVEFTKEILSVEEIKQLMATPPLENELETINAFLFSLNTGLRHIDIRNLKYKNIRDGQLIFIQSKTREQNIVNLNSKALKLIGDYTQKPKEDYVFKLPSLVTVLKHISSWVDRAGIHKHITFHCGRHTFATNLLLNGENIKTVSELLGHTSLEHTDKYVHIVDKVKRDATNKLSEMYG